MSAGLTPREWLEQEKARGLGAIALCRTEAAKRRERLPGDNGQGADEPLRTVTARDRLGLVTVHGQDYVIVDIGMRMLTPRELFNAQGFPDAYRVEDVRHDGKLLTLEALGRLVGNSVAPPLARALVAANVLGEGVAPSDMPLFAEVA